MAAAATWWWKTSRSVAWQQYGLDYEPQDPQPSPHLLLGHRLRANRPYAERAGYDLMIQAMSGLMSITGRGDDVARRRPTAVGVAVIDVFTGCTPASYPPSRPRSKPATSHVARQHIDMALLDVGMAILANQAAGFWNTGTVPGARGNSHPSPVPYQDFPTQDGAMLLAIGNDGQFWPRFCRGLPPSPNGPGCALCHQCAAVGHRSELVPLMEAVTRQRTTAQWIALLQPQGRTWPHQHPGPGFCRRPGAAPRTGGASPQQSCTSRFSGPNAPSAP